MANTNANTQNSKTNENEKSAMKTQQQKLEDAYHLAEQATTEAVGEIKKQTQAKLDAGSETVQDATKQAENIIRERPLLSIGCAFLAGWAVSKLVK